MAKEKYKKEDVAQALRDTKGQITLAARKLGCASNTIRNYFEKYPDLKDVQVEEHEKMGDAVELALYDEAVNKRNTAALIFLAKTKYKERGYVERVEQTGANGGAMEHNVNVRNLPPLANDTLKDILNGSNEGNE